MKYSLSNCDFLAGVDSVAIAGLPEDSDNFNDELVSVDEDAVSVTAGKTAYQVIPDGT